MIELFIALAFLVYCLPGLPLARGIYSQQVRAVRQPGVLIKPYPVRPPRPEMKVIETLHEKKCDYIAPKGSVCNCVARDKWLKLKSDWDDYQEWNRFYDHLAYPDGTSKRGKLFNEPSGIKAMLAVPIWPMVLMAMYVKGGANSIPDYREIERLEQETKELV